MGTCPSGISGKGGRCRCRKRLEEHQRWLLWGHVSHWGDRLLGARIEPGIKSKGHIRSSYSSRRGAAWNHRASTVVVESRDIGGTEVLTLPPPSCSPGSNCPGHLFCLPRSKPHLCLQAFALGVLRLERFSVQVFGVWLCTHHEASSSHILFPEGPFLSAIPKVLPPTVPPLPSVSLIALSQLLLTFLIIRNDLDLWLTCALCIFFSCHISFRILSVSSDTYFSGGSLSNCLLNLEVVSVPNKTQQSDPDLDPDNSLLLCKQIPKGSNI